MNYTYFQLNKSSEAWDPLGKIASIFFRNHFLYFQWRSKRNYEGQEIMYYYRCTVIWFPPDFLVNSWYPAILLGYVLTIAAICNFMVALLTRIYGFRFRLNIWKFITLANATKRLLSFPKDLNFIQYTGFITLLVKSIVKIL